MAAQLHAQIVAAAATQWRGCDVRPRTKRDLGLLGRHGLDEAQRPRNGLGDGLHGGGGAEAQSISSCLCAAV